MMDEILTQKIRNDFDCLAQYEQVGSNHNNHYHKFLLKQLPLHCESVLDIGCGTGAFSRLLAEHCDRVVAIDLSPKMIKVAQQNSREYTNIDFQIGDILQWKFPVEEFEAIVSIAAVHHLPLENLLPSLKNALKPGGKLIILDLLAHESLYDFISDLIAVPLNWILQIVKNKQINQSPEATAAMREHLRTDNYLTRSQTQQVYTRFCEGAEIRKHLFWRYSAIWEKPIKTP